MKLLARLGPLESRNINVSEQYVKSLAVEGKRILVTRAREQAGVLSERLQAVGAIPVEFPVIRIMPPQDWEPLDSALGKLFLADAKNLPYYAWLIFTSANGVNIFCERLLSLGFHTENMLGVRVAAIGPATAAALAHYDITADLVPSEYIAESVATALIEDTQRREESLEGKRILLPRAAEARQVLVTELEQARAIVDEEAAYTTVAAAGDDEQGREVLHLLQNGQIDIITFTSSSTVRNFMQWLTSCVGESEVGDLHAGQLKIACIGPITSQTACELGLKVDIEAREFTINGLVEAIIQS